MDKWLKRVRKEQSSPQINSNSNYSEEHSIPSCSTNSDVTFISQRESNDNVKKRKVVRKYDPSYLKYGFTVNNDGIEPKPQCVICFETLSNQSMKPSLLTRHLSTKHATLETKPQDYFHRKMTEFKGSKKVMSSYSGTNQKAVEAYFLVSLKIAKCGKPFTIGEDLVLPAAKDMVECMLGKKAAKQLNIIPLSNDTVRRRIDTMSSQVKDQLISEIKQSEFFSIQIDESTDITNYAQLMVYVRYETGIEIKEDFLFCEALETRTTADEIFKKLYNFFEENGLEWKRCVGFCSDGARAMTGKYGGVTAKVKYVAPDCEFVHCWIHREALAAKRMPAELQIVLNEAIKVVNFIKSRALNSRLFSVLCADMGSDHIQLLLHTEVRWLSRGKTLSRLFELRSEVQVFLINTNFEFRDRFCDEKWLSRLAYLADIFSRLNDFNLSLSLTS